MKSIPNMDTFGKDHSLSAMDQMVDLDFEDHKSLQDSKSAIKNGSTVITSPRMTRDFNQTQVEAIKKIFSSTLMKLYLDVTEYEVKFSMKRFIAGLLYHMLFFTIGIIGAFIIILFENYNYVRNMCFIGLTNPMVLCIQHMQNIVYELMFILYYLTPVYYTQRLDLILPSLTILTRCFVIAIRYSLMSHSRYVLMREHKSKEWVGADLIVLQWDTLNLDSLEKEIRVRYHQLNLHIL